MNELFLKWIEDKTSELQEIGIITESINLTPEDIPNPCTTVDHISHICLGRISVWESGAMDVEILHYKTAKCLLFEHHELNTNSNFDKVLEMYFRVLVNGFPNVLNYKF